MRRRVYMHFMLRGSWYCQFLEEDLQTPLKKTLSFADADKVLELAKRGGCEMSTENRQAFELAVDKGRGGLWLSLTAEQYAKLKVR